MRSLAFVALIAASFLANVRACDDDDHAHDQHTLAHRRRAYPSVPLTPPTRPLEWGDLNIIHTTDTHGWLLGHQKSSFPEPNYSGDWGELASFVSHIKELALEKDVDLLLVDSGDIHDGTGLTDGFPPGDVNGHESNQFFKQLPYDVLAIGNHELYEYGVALDMHNDFAPAFPGRYLTSNVNITLNDENGQNVSVPIGDRFAKFQTRKGRNVTALGVLFDFTGNSDNTTVQPVADMVKEQWFLDAIDEEPDLFLLAGHMPVSNNQWPVVFDAVRAVHPTAPILILGGHAHVRDCQQFDGRSIALASGRYMETVGWLSADLDGVDSNENITFNRRYLDTNRVTYQYHTLTSNDTFDTSDGKSLTSGLWDLHERFNLSYVFGTAPQDYYLTRAPYPSNNSLLSFISDQAIPIGLSVDNPRADIPSLMIINSGAQRFDLYSGPFTRDDQFTISTFPNTFVYLPNVTLGDANEVFSIMNEVGETRRRRRSLADNELAYARGNIDDEYSKWLEDMYLRWLLTPEKREDTNLTLGYVTTDQCPGEGDDTVHAALPFYRPPTFGVSQQPNVTDDELVDLVFTNFLQPQVLETVNEVQSEKVFTADDVQSYSDVLLNEILGVFAQAAWN